MEILTLTDICYTEIANLSDLQSVQINLEEKIIILANRLAPKICNTIVKMCVFIYLRVNRFENSDMQGDRMSSNLTGYVLFLLRKPRVLQKKSTP